MLLILLRILAESSTEDDYIKFERDYAYARIKSIEY